MVWNKDPFVKDLSDLAKKWGVHQIIVVGINLKDGNLITASYGENKPLCEVADSIRKQIETKIQNGEITP